MTVQHSGGLHAAWLLNVCVCACVCLRVCVCEDFLKSSHVGNISWCLRYKEWCVCPSVRFVSWCLLFFNFCATGPDCMTRTATGTATLLHIWLRVHVGWPATASESQISYSQSTSAVWERERDAETEGGGKRKRELKCPSLSPSVCLPVTLDSSVAIQSDQTPYRLSFSGPVRLQQPQLHRKRGWNKQESKRGVDEERYIPRVWRRRRAKWWPQWHEALTAGRRNAGKQDN